ncbi:TPA: hypothetical protein QEL68_000739 [Stenotrophomonas maltophilia]|nr:hypothetical protein [Stenotrophomonas maltophilia]
MRRLSNVRWLANTNHIDERAVVREFMESGCSCEKQNEMYERARRQRMNQGHGPKGVA